MSPMECILETKTSSMPVLHSVVPTGSLPFNCWLLRAKTDLKVAPPPELLTPGNHPTDSRAMRVVETLLADPGDQRDLKKLCKNSGASKRTIQRIFLEETKMNFGRWRQQLRLLHALQLLASGKKVAEAAWDAGYCSASAFISMFRRQLGQTPRRYFETRDSSLT